MPTPPMDILRADERGLADHGWLKSRHTFSFADYHNPKRMGFRALRVINDDRVAGGKGFGRHSHADMEIISYPLEGALEHKDSMGTGSVIRPGDVQRMSAGTGVAHSEYNASPTELVHFLQIWILPDKRGHQPGYEQKAFSAEEKRGKLRLVASPDGAEGSITIHQDAKLYAGLFDAGEKATHALAAGRHAWLHVARGSIELNGTKLAEGDAAGVTGAATLEVSGGKDAEILLFDLA
ncbi:MAG TPA: pirin family protein [Polyangiaceae bacterium]